MITQLYIEELRTLYSKQPIAVLALATPQTIEGLFDYTALDLRDIIDAKIPYLSDLAKRVLNAKAEMLRAIYKAQRA